MNKRRLLPWVLCLSILMLFCIVPAKAEETEPEAEEITRNYTFAKNNSEINALYTHDGKLVTYNTYGPEDVLHIRPKGDWTMHILFFRFALHFLRLVFCANQLRKRNMKKLCHFSQNEGIRKVMASFP